MVGNVFPAYPDFREISFEDKKSLDEAFKAYPPRISEYTFTNLFAWRETVKVFLSQIDETILVKRRTLNSEQLYLLPPIGHEGIVETASRIISRTEKGKMPAIYGVDAAQAEPLRANGFDIRDMRDQWDYVYRVSDLTDLPSGKYHAKRKQISKCVAGHSPEYRPLIGDMVERCLQMQRDWCDLRHCDSDLGLEAENRAIRETLLRFGDLNVFGGVVLIGGEIEAFTVGERLNEDTAVVHFEKANSAIDGLYQFVNQQFCANALQGFSYVNREQDLGIPGLRRAKLSYHPTFFVEKCLATAGTWLMKV